MLKKKYTETLKSKISKQLSNRFLDAISGYKRKESQVSISKVSIEKGKVEKVDKDIEETPMKITAEDHSSITDISESDNEGQSPLDGLLKLEMFALSKKSTADERRRFNARRKEEREQRALNIHKRNMVISYHSNNCNSTANSNLT